MVLTRASLVMLSSMAWALRRGGIVVALQSHITAPQFGRLFVRCLHSLHSSTPQPGNRPPRIVFSDELPQMRSLAEIERRENMPRREDGDEDEDEEGDDKIGDEEEGDDEEDGEEEEEEEEEEGDNDELPEGWALPSLSPKNGPAMAAKKAKRAQNKPHVPYPLNEADLEETFVRGSGPGGQSINKTKNMVQLIHVPSGLRVHCQEARDLTTNRKIARKLMRDKLDLLDNGASSRLGKQYAKIKKRKAKKRSRSGAKYGSGGDKGAADKKAGPESAPESSAVEGPGA